MQEQQVVETSILAIDLVSLIASIASFILAILAIWLSIFFFRMSSEASRITTEASKGIDASVQRLEKLFDKLYSDTFSIMKDTVSDMRKHIWPESNEQQDSIAKEAEQRAEKKINELKKNVDKELSELLNSQKVADEKMSTIREELTHVMNRAINTSRRLENEAREETIRSRILTTIEHLKYSTTGPTARAIINYLEDAFPSKRVADELQAMKHERIIDYAGDYINPETIMIIKE